MYTITTTNKFDKSLKLCKKRNYDLSLLRAVIDLLQKEGKLPQKKQASQIIRKLQRLFGMPHKTRFAFSLETKRY